LEQLPHFVKKLRATDEVAVEVTSNTRLFYDAVAPHVARVMVVDPNPFRVISQSVKKTDPNDARNRSRHHCAGQETSRDYLSHAEKQLGVPGISQFRFARSHSVKRTSVTTE
jgi:hypothetical protein